LAALASVGMSLEHEPKVCRRVLYSGRVQGVGFRYTAQRLSGNYAIGGYVRNLPDGRVELVAEGPEPDVDAFLHSVDRSMAGYIESEQRENIAALGLADFRIKH
jgi:acylphosphatase